MSTTRMTRIRYLQLECVALFAMLPIVLWLLPIRGLLFATLWGLAAVCLWHYRRSTGTPLARLWDWRTVPQGVWPSVLVRFALCATLMTGFTWLHDADRFFSLPLQRPALWGIIMMIYPLLSVIPQEIIYRLFFFHRYRSLFADERLMVCISGLAFGHAHLAFNNWVAYSMSMVGGWLFAHSYARSRSFALIWTEHTLYGCFVFTVGLGWYFYSGAQFATR